MRISQDGRVGAGTKKATGRIENKAADEEKLNIAKKSPPSLYAQLPGWVVLSFG